MNTSSTPALNLSPAAASGQAQPSPEAADKAAADKAAADKAAADKAAADKAAADKAEEETRKPARRRRGPPADGSSEKRVMMVLTTSKLTDANGVRLRRGRLASVPDRRVDGLVAQGRARLASADEIEVLTRRHGRAELG